MFRKNEKLKDVNFSDYDILFPTQKLHHCLFITYTDSSDEYVMVKGYVVENQYLLKDNHKIEIKPYDERYSKGTFYVSDFNIMLNEGRARIIPKVVDYGVGT